MAGITTAIGLGLGAASFGFGLYEKQKGQQQSQAGYALAQAGAQVQGAAAAAKAGISKEQAAKSVEFAGRNFELERTGALQSLNASLTSQQIQREIIAQERRAEAQRMQGMELDARRRQLEIIRNQQRARALGLTTATAQGAGRGSGLQGGYGQIAGQTGVDLLGVQQNLQIGRNMFAINEAISNQRVAGAELESLYATQRAALTTAKSQMMYDYASANAAFQSRMADTDVLMAQGAGMSAAGQGGVSAGQMLSSSGSSFMNIGMQLPGMFNSIGNMAQTQWGKPTPISSATSTQVGGFGQYGYKGIY